MVAVLMVLALAVLGLWLSFAVIHVVFRLLFGMIGLVFGGIVAFIAGAFALLVLLLVGGLLGMLLLPLLVLTLLPLAAPLLLIAGIAWVLTRQSRSPPRVMPAA